MSEVMQQTTAFVFRWTKIIGFWLSAVSLTYLICFMEIDGRPLAIHAWEVFESKTVQDKIQVVSKGARGKLRDFGAALSIAGQNVDSSEVEAPATAAASE